MSLHSEVQCLRRRGSRAPVQLVYQKSKTKERVSIIHEFKETAAICYEYTDLSYLPSHGKMSL